MSVTLRVILVLISVFTCLYIARKLKKSQIELMDTVFWILLSVLFVVISIFPQIVYWGSYVLGFQAPINFIFLLVIGLLLLRTFMMNIKLSQLEDKLRNLTQELAVRENMKKKDK